MSRSAALSGMVWLATMVMGRPLALAQEKTSDPPASSASHSVASSSSLQRSPSSTYYPFRSSTEARQAPDRSAPVVFTITSESQPLKAVGMVSERDPDISLSGENQAPNRTWIKLKSASGSLGFVELADLITPQQLESKKQSSKKLNIFQAELDAVKRSSGSIIPGGIYSLGGRCDVGFDAHVDTIAFLSNKVMVWQEADKLHFVHVLDPLAPVVYDILNDSRTVELQGFGYVQMKTFRSEQDTALMGFKNKLLWFTASGTQFDSYQLCDPGTYDPLVSMLKTYAGQRPPEQVRTDLKQPAQ